MIFRIILAFHLWYSTSTLPAEVRCQGSRGQKWSRLQQHHESRRRPWLLRQREASSGSSVKEGSCVVPPHHIPEAKPPEKTIVSCYVPVVDLLYLMLRKSRFHFRGRTLALWIIVICQCLWQWCSYKKTVIKVTHNISCYQIGLWSHVKNSNEKILWKYG